MSKQVSIPDGLYSQLSEEAKKNNVPVETLTAQILESALAKPTYSSLVRAITQAYAKGQPTPYLGDWSQVEEELKATNPAFQTLEDAMNYSRGNRQSNDAVVSLTHKIRQQRFDTG